MTTPTDALIERLEAAEQGSRGLDALIAVEIGQLKGECYLDGSEASMSHLHYLAEGIHLPCYTTSVDAALTLIPKEHSFELMASAVENFAPGSFTRCRLWDWRRGPLMSDPNNEWKSEGNRQLPLNIVIAALRSRAGGGR